MNLSPNGIKVLIGIVSLTLGLAIGYFRWYELRKSKHPTILKIIDELIFPSAIGVLIALIVGVCAIALGLYGMIAGN